MDTITKGYLGQILFEQKMLEHGWDLFRPILENGRVDSIGIKNNKLLKFQIKIICYEKDGSKKMYVRKISHNMGEYKIHLYTEDEIDFFIGVDIKTSDIYIVPISFSSKYKSCISINTLAFFKNNFDLLEKEKREEEILEEFNLEINKNISNNGAKAVNMLDKDTKEILKTFDSIANASKFLEKEHAGSHISDVCKGKRQTAYGYMWEYVK